MSADPGSAGDVFRFVKNFDLETQIGGNLQRLLLSIFFVIAPLALADTICYTGTLSDSEDIFETTFTLTSTENVTLQTYGFGGGVNAAGTTISPGGTDPFLAIFSGTGPDADILTDGFGNAFGSSLDLSNYGSFQGCPPAGTVTIGGNPQCGDIMMTLDSLAAGTYTVVLADGQYIADAVFDNGTLGEGFTDFTGGVFCNIDINSVDCPNTSGAYALDITEVSSAVTTATPEPAPVSLITGALLLIAAGIRRFRFRSR